jgi:hypothetical protein
LGSGREPDLIPPVVCLINELRVFASLADAKALLNESTGERRSPRVSTMASIV